MPSRLLRYPAQALQQLGGWPGARLLETAARWDTALSGHVLVVVPRIASGEARRDPNPIIRTLVTLRLDTCASANVAATTDAFFALATTDPAPASAIFETMATIGYRASHLGVWGRGHRLTE